MADFNASWTTTGATLVGTAGADSLDNGDDSKVIDAQAGNDLVTVSGQYMTVEAGAGNDTIISKGAENIINGGSGDDSINASNYDTVTGGTGNDIFLLSTGSQGVVVTDYGNGNDTIQIVGGTLNSKETISGGLVLNIASSKATVKNYKDNKLYHFIMSDKTHLIESGGSYTSITGSSSNDSIIVTGQYNTINPSTGTDTITLGSNNVLYSYTGTDIVYGYNETDTIKFDNFDATKSTIDGSDVAISTNSGNGVVSLIGGAGVLINTVDNSKNVKQTVFMDGKPINIITSTKASASVTGEDYSDSIVVSGKNTTINAGGGDDTVTVFDGAIYQFGADDGEDVIYNYSEKDTIQILGGNFEGVADTETGNVVVTVEQPVLDDDNNTISTYTGHITVIGGKGKVINFLDSNKNLYSNVYNGDGTDVKLVYNSDDNSNINGTDGIDYIVVNGKGNVINTAEGDDTVKLAEGDNTIKYSNGGGDDYIMNYSSLSGFVLDGISSIGASIKGSDVIAKVNDGSVTFASGKTVTIKSEDERFTSYNGSTTLKGLDSTADTFLYTIGDGNESIVGYEAGKDIIELQSSGTTISAAGVKGSDVTLTIGTNTLTIVESSDTKLSIINSEDEVTYGAQIYGSKSIDIADGDGDTINTAMNTSVITLNAGGTIDTVQGVRENDIRTTNVYLMGNNNANVLYGGSGENTLAGGAGNDTYYGNESYTIVSGSGDDTQVATISSGDDSKSTFYYTAGNDVIDRYADGKDTIQIGKGAISTYAFSGDDVKFTVKDGSTTLGTITVKNGKNKYIAVIDDDGTKDGTYSDKYRKPNELVVTNDSVSELGGDPPTVTSADTKVTLIDAASEYTGEDALYIIGNAAANTLIASSNDDTLNGGKGNDTLVGGAGKNVFLYTTGEGNDLIVDYEEQDKIQFATAATAISSAAKSGNNIKFTIGKGALTVKDAADKKITLLNSEGDNVLGSQIYGQAAITIGADDGDTINTTANTAVRTISVDDERNTGVYIIGNTAANTIIASGNGDTLYGRTGNDSLVGGAGKDVFIFGNADGNNVIKDYDEGDVIKIISGALSSTSIKNDDVLLTIGKTKVTVQGAKDKKITVEDVNGNTYSQQFGVTDLTVDEDDGATIDTSGNTSVVNIDASDRNDDVYIIGNAKANNITAGTGNTTIKSGAGKDTIAYSGGSLYIADYTAAQDVISLAAGVSITAAESVAAVAATDDTASSPALIKLTTSEGTISIAGVIAGNATKPSYGKVTVVDSEGNVTSQAYGTKSIAVASTDIAKGGTLDLTANTAVATVNASGRAAAYPIYIIGNSNDNSIKGGAGADTLYGGEGDTNTLTGAGGKDVFLIDGKNNVVITDYAAGQDVIKLTDDANITNASLDGTKLVLTIGDDKNVTVVGGKNKKISVATKTGTDDDDNPIYETTTQVYAATALTVLNTDGSTIDLTAPANAGVITVNASNRAKTYPINIIGNSNNNVIKGGKGEDTLSGGTGNDTLTGGLAADTFIYSGGKDVITDYSYAQGDVITLGGDVELGEYGDTGKNYYINGKDVVFYVDEDNTLTVKNAKGATINVNGTEYTCNDYRETIFAANSTETEYSAAGDSNIVTIDASKQTKNGISLTGNSNANVIKGSAKADIIDGNGGNDTLTGGKGNDTFAYTSGDVVITDYTAGDVIQIASDVGSVTGASISGSKDLVLTIGEAGDKTITLKNGKGKKVSISDGTTTITQVYAVTSIALANGDVAAGGTFDATGAVNTNLKTINASSRTAVYPIYIKGNSVANVIKGGKGADTIEGGYGSDTLSGGAGNDLFIYDGQGADVITDYAAGDVIDIGSNTIVHSAVKSSNLIFTIGDNTLTLTKGSGKKVTVKTNDATSTQIYGDGDKSTLVATDTDASVMSASTNVVNGDFSVKGIDASTRKLDISLTANDLGNALKGGTGADTLTGGKGDDTLTGGAGKDIFVYDGQGDDVITDYAANTDKIVFNGTWDTVSISGNNVILRVDENNSLTIKNGKGKKLTISDDVSSAGGTYTYSKSTILSAAAQYEATETEEPWFARDDNVVTFDSATDDLDTILETTESNYSVGKTETVNLTELTAETKGTTLPVVYAEGKDDK